jgi:hypothetical protein
LVNTSPELDPDPDLAVKIPFRIRQKGPDPAGSRIRIPNTVQLLCSEHVFEAKKGGFKKIGIQSKGWELLRP